MAVLVVLLILVTVTGKSGNKTITVASSGTALARPEKVSIIVTRVEVGSDLNVLMKSGSEALDKFSDLAKKSGGTKVELRRGFVQITPQADGKYIVANALSIKSEKVDITKTLVADLYNSGATTVSNVDFGLKEGSSAENDARNNAITKSKDRAAAVAKSMNKRLGNLMSVIEDGQVTVSGDENQIEVGKNLTVIYEVK